mgnify:FL=1
MFGPAPPADPVTRPAATVVAPALAELPLWCRLGWHRWLNRVLLRRRRAGRVELCSVTARCGRKGCSATRHEQNRPVPWRLR